MGFSLWAVLVGPAALAGPVRKGAAGNVEVASDIPVVVLPGGGVNPHVAQALTMARFDERVEVSITDAKPTARHCPDKPSRTVRVEIKTPNSQVTFLQFPFPLGLEQGEVYSVPRVQQEFGYPLYLALQMVGAGDATLSDAPAIDATIAQLRGGANSLREAMGSFPLALQYLLPPFLDEIDRKILDASPDCGHLLAGGAPNLPTRAVLGEIARQFYVSVTDKIALWVP